MSKEFVESYIQVHHYEAGREYRYFGLKHGERLHFLGYFRLRFANKNDTTNKTSGHSWWPRIMCGPIASQEWLGLGVQQWLKCATSVVPMWLMVLSMKPYLDSALWVVLASTRATKKGICIAGSKVCMQ